MRISYNWLKEYVNVRLQPDRLAQALTMAGLSVESVKALGSDHIFELEITANRPDWLSVIGVAREVAALTGGKLNIPSIPKVKVKASGGRGAKIRVEERGLCPRYTARIIKNVKVGESPQWLKVRIEAMGLRSVNNIVDITNFCLFETGEPMHAFDLDKITGSEVIIRKALQGEKIILIDGAEKTLDKSMLVIADSKSPIAIAGVMGALNTEVTGSTKNILLEAAYFDQVSVRRTSRKLAIATESSYRFERRVDIENIVYSSNRALELIMKLAGGEAGAFIDIGAREAKKNIIDIRPGRVNKLLGTDISAGLIKKTALALGMDVKSSSGKKLKLEAPNFRSDLRTEVDVIEEIARIYGYDKIPVTLPKIVEQPMRMDQDMVVRNRVRECLAALGADEIMTYSLLNKKAIISSGVRTDSLVSISNPLTTEQEAMRPSLIPGMLNAVMWNINRKTKDLKLFEIGNVYFKKDEKFGEKKNLAIAITGQSFTGWVVKPVQADFFELKGIVETLYSELGIEAVEFSRVLNNGFSRSECAQIHIAGEAVGVMGLISQKVLHEFDIKDKVYLLEVDLDAILKHVRMEKRFAELSKYPSVYRDISIVVAREILNSEIMSVMKAAGAVVLKDARLIDRYEGKQVPEGKQSLTYRLEYCDPAKTLEEKEILNVHGRMLGELEAKFGAKLR
ncbi:MAG: phenylalanine--tRNA ligase subunit beta [Candidatus Omnitrophica bacterium]|nr:phenylalanine--tRNA ligase subunit beta [Candidatus Omnitrophota bacterium]